MSLLPIHLPEDPLFIREGKGGKSRATPFGARTLEWLERYLQKSRPLIHMESHEKALFLSMYGRRFIAESMGNLVRRIMDLAGIQRTGACHLFRHTCATHMLENGADIRYIQQLLGHSQLNTTQIYTQMTITQLREVYARTHPHGK